MQDIAYDNEVTYHYKHRNGVSSDHQKNYRKLVFLGLGYNRFHYKMNMFFCWKSRYCLGLNKYFCWNMYPCIRSWPASLVLALAI